MTPASAFNKEAEGWGEWLHSNISGAGDWAGRQYNAATDNWLGRNVVKPTAGLVGGVVDNTVGRGIRMGTGVVNAVGGAVGGTVSHGAGMALRAVNGADDPTAAAFSAAGNNMYGTAQAGLGDVAHLGSTAESSRQNANFTQNQAMMRQTGAHGAANVTSIASGVGDLAAGGALTAGASNALTAGARAAATPGAGNAMSRFAQGAGQQVAKDMPNAAALGRKVMPRPAKALPTPGSPTPLAAPPEPAVPSTHPEAGGKVAPQESPFNVVPPEEQLFDPTGRVRPAPVDAARPGSSPSIPPNVAAAGKAPTRAWKFGDNVNELGLPEDLARAHASEVGAARVGDTGRGLFQRDLERAVNDHIESVRANPGPAGRTSPVRGRDFEPDPITGGIPRSPAAEAGAAPPVAGPSIPPNVAAAAEAGAADAVPSTHPLASLSVDDDFRNLLNRNPGSGPGAAQAAPTGPGRVNGKPGNVPPTSAIPPEAAAAGAADATGAVGADVAGVGADAAGVGAAESAGATGAEAGAAEVADAGATAAGAADAGAAATAIPTRSLGSRAAQVAGAAGGVATAAMVGPHLVDLATQLPQKIHSKIDGNVYHQTMGTIDNMDAGQALDNYQGAQATLQAIQQQLQNGQPLTPELSKQIEVGVRNMIPQLVKSTGEDPSALWKKYREGGFDQNDIQQLLGRPDIQQTVEQAEAQGAPDPENSIIQHLTNLPTEQKVALGIGIPMALLGLLSGTMGEGGLGAFLMSILGIGATAFGAGMFGGTSAAPKPAPQAGGGGEMNMSQLQKALAAVTGDDKAMAELAGSSGIPGAQSLASMFPETARSYGMSYAKDILKRHGIKPEQLTAAGAALSK